ncbi:multidrug efflux SMR transporter [Pseudomonas batumici]|uniref:DMT family transporter n=1 Tax=Pseudomonas batumici TaxID=226910 RepID=UPI0030D59159
MHWLFLLAAIASEILGVMAMKYASIDMPLIGYTLMSAAIALSFFFLAMAVKVIPVAVAYAAWEGVGLIAVAVLSVALFGETINLQKIIGLLTVFLGVLMMERGVEDSHPEPATAKLI